MCQKCITTSSKITVEISNKINKALKISSAMEEKTLSNVDDRENPKKNNE